MFTVTAVSPYGRAVRLTYKKSAWIALSRTVADAFEEYGPTVKKEETPFVYTRPKHEPEVAFPRQNGALDAPSVLLLDAFFSRSFDAKGVVREALELEKEMLAVMDRILKGASRGPISLGAAIGFADWAEMPLVLDILCEFAAARLLANPLYFACNTEERAILGGGMDAPDAVACATCSKMATGKCGTCLSMLVFCSEGCMAASSHVCLPTPLGFVYPMDANPCFADLLFPPVRTRLLDVPVGGFNNVERYLILSRYPPWKWIREWTTDLADTESLHTGNVPARRVLDVIPVAFPAAFGMSTKVFEHIVVATIRGEGDIFFDAGLLQDEEAVRYVLGYTNPMHPERELNAEDLENLLLLSIEFNLRSFIRLALDDPRLDSVGSTKALRVAVWIIAGRAADATTTDLLLAEKWLSDMPYDEMYDVIWNAAVHGNMAALTRLLPDSRFKEVAFTKEIMKVLMDIPEVGDTVIRLLVEEGPFVEDPASLFELAAQTGRLGVVEALLSSIHTNTQIDRFRGLRLAYQADKDLIVAAILADPNLDADPVINADLHVFVESVLANGKPDMLPLFQAYATRRGIPLR
jgi:hypothetical protein